MIKHVYFMEADLAFANTFETINRSNKIVKPVARYVDDDGHDYICKWFQYYIVMKQLFTGKRVTSFLKNSVSWKLKS